jgi:hypothetical protein
MPRRGRKIKRTDGPLLTHNPCFVQLLEAAGERVRHRRRATGRDAHAGGRNHGGLAIFLSPLALVLFDGEFGGNLQSSPAQLLP